jgi:hypothetical protein
LLRLQLIGIPDSRHEGAKSDGVVHDYFLARKKIITEMRSERQPSVWVHPILRSD